MAHLGDVYTSNGKFFAKIETREASSRFHMEGPRREGKREAEQDLIDIRAAAGGEPTRLGELRAMKLATKRLQDEAKAATRGGIKAVESDCFTARIQFVEDSVEQEIAGPPRRTERRYRHQAVRGDNFYTYIGPSNHIFKRIGTMVGDGTKMP